MFFSLILLIFLLLIVSKSLFIERSKLNSYFMSHYECSFMTFSILQVAYSSEFYLVIFAFMLFDLEICVITPLIFILNVSTSMLVMSFLFLLFLFFILIFELWFMF